MPAIERLITKEPKALVQKPLPPAGSFWIAKIGRKTVACAALVEIAELRSVTVDGGFRGKNIGDELVNRCLDSAERRQYRSVVLSTDITGYFERYGFEIKSGRKAMFLDMHNGKRKKPGKQ